MEKQTTIRSALGIYSFAIMTLAVILLGWWQRNEYWFTAERGWGYAFGIIGGSMMLLLLLYPLRKRLKLMRDWFSVRHWFRLHMIFGILGPLLVLLHSNFHLGSLNSSIALFCMLLVAASGVVGRYVYRQIHRGLYGELIQFEELKGSYDQSRAQLLTSNLVNEITSNKLTSVETLLTDRQITLWQSWRANKTVNRLRRKIEKQIRKKLKQKKYTGVDAVILREAYIGWNKGIKNLSRMAKYAFNSNLFSLWHVLHLPFFFMMIITATIHIVVVHMY